MRNRAFVTHLRLQFQTETEMLRYGRPVLRLPGSAQALTAESALNLVFQSQRLKISASCLTALVLPQGLLAADLTPSRHSLHKGLIGFRDGPPLTGLKQRTFNLPD